MTPLRDALEPLEWQKLSIRLVNRRNTYAREHPMFIFKGILKFACSVQNPPLQCDYLFRPARAPWPHRIQRDQVYDLEVVFPGCDAATVDRFVAGLLRQLEQTPRNFELISVGKPESRNLAALEHENDGIDTSLPEICLDFLTPLAFNAADTRRPWLLDGQSLISLCTVHIARLYQSVAWPLNAGAANVETLPYFWEPVRIVHGSKSQPRRADGHLSHQKVEGFVGPLYLRGDWQEILPLLRVCSELHTGYGRGDLNGLHAQRHNRPTISNPQGGFLLSTSRTYFDRKLGDASLFLAELRNVSENHDTEDEVVTLADRGHSLASDLARTVASGSYRPLPARTLSFEKKGGERSIAMLSARDSIVQRTMHRIMAPVVDRMLERASVGYRRGHSIDSARKLMHEAIAAGATFALRADIESFFDEIDWEVLGSALRRCLPLSDVVTLETLESCVRTPLSLPEAGKRTKGLLQGSPLSPMLANIYLDTFDEEISKRGHTLIRYGDDFVILAADEQQLAQASADVNEVLARHRVRLNPSKTVTTPIDMGFSFLGVEVPSALVEETVRQAGLKKTMYVKRPHAFVGIDGDSVVVRKGNALLARLPLYRIGEIVFMGDGAVSTRLLQRCARHHIPVSFCSPFGWYYSTLRPDSRSWFDLVAAHSRRHMELGERGMLQIAKRVVEAKLRNYHSWLRGSRRAEARIAAGQLDQILRKVYTARTVDALRGVEAGGAKVAFATIAAIATEKGFESAGRVPREKPDGLNSLLDTLYSLLFTRINVLVRGSGLSPYLGFLHSADDSYESLVCDLQEPFRCRMDRLALKLLNRGEITARDFYVENGAWKIGDGISTIIEGFEREEEVRLVGEPGTLAQLLAAQVRALRSWASGDAVQPAFFDVGSLTKAAQTQKHRQPP